VHIDWDEANLRQNEEEKVPRMKVTEPKTPYVKESMEPQEPMSDIELEEDITAHIQVGSPASSTTSSMDVYDKSRPKRRGSVSLSSEDEHYKDSDSELTEAERLRKAKFENVRKAHYGMNAAALLKKRSFDAGDSSEEDSGFEENAGPKANEQGRDRDDDLDDEDEDDYDLNAPVAQEKTEPEQEPDQARSK